MPDLPTSQSDEDVARTLGLNAKPKRPLVLRPAFLALVALGALMAGGYYWQTLVRSRIPRFEVAQARRGDLTVLVTATGTLQPVNMVEVGAEISGRLERVLVDFNARVKTGETLAEIDTKQLRAQVERSEAGLEAAEAGLKQAQATLLEATQTTRRIEQLSDSKLISGQELDASRATLARAEAGVASAKAQVTVSRALLNGDRTNLEKAVIRSPIDGVVLARKVEPGQTVAATFQTPILFKLAEDLTRMKLIVNVDEADVGVVRAAQAGTFRVDAYPDREFAARIISVRNEPLTVQGVVSYEAVLTVDNAEELLRPGMTATATIRTETRTNALLVPNAALRFVPPGAILPVPPEAVAVGREATPSYVWVLRNTQPTAVRVRKGLTDSRYTELLSGEISVGSSLLVDMASNGK